MLPDRLGLAAVTSALVGDAEKSTCTPTVHRGESKASKLKVLDMLTGVNVRRGTSSSKYAQNQRVGRYQLLREGCACQHS
jgi:UV DNA damage repair endonuclease